ncbi:MAG TPA: 23S rRNA (cytosine(1962)-C(5))-methyltransferase RlmI [Gallionellaceae bacterium]|nr:23S rRNA (cytosine(1962)-C(5))-methyltransferase RlmI [Gallionellaceae bacterium]
MTSSKSKPAQARSPSTPHRASQGNRDFRKRTQRDAKSSPPRDNAPREIVHGAADARPCLVLHAGREKSLQRRHPWIFSGAVARVDGAPASGDTLPVRDAAGNFLAWAAYSAGSQITARVWSWDEDEQIDAAFFRRKIAAALAARRALLPRPQAGEGWGEGSSAAQNTGMRLIHAESDGLPGLIVDCYGDTLVLQLGSAGPERWRDTIADILQELCNPVCIYERSDSDGRGLEGLEKRTGVLRGTLPEHVEVVEHGLRFAVDVAEGQKTGFFLDQRDNRALTETLAKDRDVLNCFCYTGGFSLYALRGGAKSVLSIDVSGDALRIADENLRNNGLDATKAEWQEADVFLALRKLRDQGKQFDFIILDPPKFAPTAAFAEKAARGYKDINLLGFKLLRPGGLLATYSCSGGISEDLFQKIVAGAALDAGVDAQIVHRLHASADHPTLLSFPEGAYLKGLVLRVAG